MKYFLAVSLLTLFTLSAYSQDSLNNRDYYLRKSKKQKKTFWVLAGGGTALLATGFIYDAAHNGQTGNGGTGSNSIVSESRVLAMGLGIMGVSMMIVSIPFKLNSSRNKSKALSISVKNEMIRGLDKNNFIFKEVPALQLSVRL